MTKTQHNKITKTLTKIKMETENVKIKTNYKYLILNTHFNIK